MDTVQVASNEKQNTVQYGDILFTGSSENLEECGITSVVTKVIQENIYLNSFCFGYRLHENILLPNFCKFLFRSYEIRKKIIKCANGVTRYNISKEKLKKIKIPVPPIAVQQEIVKVLDTFSELTAELTAELAAELAARKKQYAYYKHKLLSFENLIDLSPNGVEYKELSELCDIMDSYRKPITKEKRISGIYPYYGANGIQDYIDSYIFDGTYILMGEDGSVINKDNTPVLNWATGKIWVNNHAHVLKEKSDMLLRFLYYYLQTIDISAIVRGTPPKITQQDLKILKIPVPPLEVQEYIVNILDKFDSLVNDIMVGLPAEIAARQKQYAYYRDKLLTFASLK